MNRKIHAGINPSVERNMLGIRNAVRDWSQGVKDQKRKVATAEGGKLLERLRDAPGILLLSVLFCCSFCKIGFPVCKYD